MAQISIFRQPSQAIQYYLSGCLNALSLSQTKPIPCVQSQQQRVKRVLTMWELFRRQLQGTPEDYKPAWSKMLEEAVLFTAVEVSWGAAR